MTSGWHHHGDYESVIYVLTGALRMEFGPGGGHTLEAGPGDFLFVPKGAVHRESNPTGDVAEILVFLWMPRILSRYSIPWVIGFSLLFLLLTAVFLAAGFLHWACWLPLPVVVALWVFVVSFFRDPERKIPADPRALLSPAETMLITSLMMSTTHWAIATAWSTASPR